MIGGKRAFASLLIVGVLGFAAALGVRLRVQAGAAPYRPARAGPTGALAGGVAAGVTRADSADGVAAEGRLGRTGRKHVRRQGPLCRICRVPAMSRCDLPALVAHANGERHHPIPKTNPGVALGDFSKPDPFLTFKLNDVAFVYGTNGNNATSSELATITIRQRLSGTSSRTWRTYLVQPNTDWWVPLYPASRDNSKRPTGPLCDGCHSANFDVQTKLSPSGTSVVNDATGPAANTWTPGSGDHHESSEAGLCIVRTTRACNAIPGPAHEESDRRPILRLACRFPRRVELKDFWKLEEHHLGETTFTHFPDGTGAEKSNAGRMISSKASCIAAASPASVAMTCMGRI